MVLRTVVLALALVVLSLAAGAPAAPAGTQPRAYVVPGERAFPEGITTRPGTDEFYVSSTADGTIFRGVVGRPRLRAFLPGGRHGRTKAVGVRATRDRLVVLGGELGLVWVYELPSGKLLRRFSTPPGGILNDVAITPAGDAYLTDSRRAELLRIPARALARARPGIRPLRPFLTLSAEDAPGGYPNGIVADGRRRLVVGLLASGRLLRVDLPSKRVRRIEVSGTELPTIDGLARDGRTLFVVNSTRRVTQVRLARTALRARFERHFESPGFRFPSTVAALRDRLLVVNYQLGANPPVLPFTVSSVRR
jgi:sugar lactone lactonase YvrE